MVDLNSLVVFATVVEVKSFSEAARRLNMPVSTVSRRVTELEDQLGVRLIERSTRSIRVTDIGAEVLEQGRRTTEIRDAVTNVVSDRLANISGTLRISAPPSISDTLLEPLAGAFQSSYPDVRIQIFITERYVDHISEGIDLVFRIGRGATKDSGLIARKIMSYRHRLLASPAYVEKHASPQKPGDLASHRLVAFAQSRPESSWTFHHINGVDTETLQFTPRFSVNDFAGVASALLAGRGIGDLPPVVRPDLVRDGKLVEVMPDWHFRTYDLMMVHLGNRNDTRALRVFKEFATTMIPSLFPDLPF